MLAPSTFIPVGVFGAMFLLFVLRAVRMTTLDTNFTWDFFLPLVADYAAAEPDESTVVWTAWPEVLWMDELLTYVALVCYDLADVLYAVSFRYVVLVDE